jgi:hypothetical protein
MIDPAVWDKYLDWWLLPWGGGVTHAHSFGRPTPCCILIDRIGAHLFKVIDHVGEWHPDGEP